MIITTRDWIVIACVIALLGFLLTGKGRLKAGNVPNNDKHRSFYESISKGGDRIVIEKGCITCHGAPGTSLSKQHPPKEQCLICHKLAHVAR
jgi:hypothetical protein